MMQNTKVTKSHEGKAFATDTLRPFRVQAGTMLHKLTQKDAVDQISPEGFHGLSRGDLSPGGHGAPSGFFTTDYTDLH